MPRLFFALQPEPAQRAAIAAGMLPAVQALGAKPVAEADLHLTLSFLGEVAAEAIPALLLATEGIASMPIELSLAQVDCWKGPRVLCLLPEDSAGVAAARRLASSLGEASRAAGPAPDERAFRAHVTIARKAPSAAFHSRHWPEPLRAALPFTASSFVLMESTPAPAGQRYNVVRSWPPRDV